MKKFDDVEEGTRLMRIAVSLVAEFADEIKREERLYQYIKVDAERLGYKKVFWPLLVRIFRKGDDPVGHER